ncbi:MAG: 16S rRNA (guanine(966)-N(2))-methyltransferase RsmD [Pseudomonadota bacterium]
MRIIGGEYRGRALASVGKGDAAAHLRPTTDRVRESLFNVLMGGRYGDPVTDAVVLDLFAGTGALGLEALSRGAASATFVENGRKSLRLLRDNIAMCRARDRTTIAARDALRTAPPPTTPASLVFLDPPYGKAMGETALTAHLHSGWLQPGALIIWEESSAITPPDTLQLLETRKMGGTTLSFLRA